MATCKITEHISIKNGPMRWEARMEKDGIVCVFNKHNGNSETYERGPESYEKDMEAKGYTVEYVERYYR